MDYDACAYAHVRATLGLNTQPKASLAVTSAYKGVIYGERLMFALI